MSMSKAKPLPQRRWLRNLAADFHPWHLGVLAILTVVFVLTAYPFFYTVSMAVMPYENYVSKPLHIGPSGFTTQYFEDILSRPQLTQAFGVSIARTIVGTTLNVIVTMMAAYALSRPKLALKRFLTVFFLIPLFFHAGIIPFFLVIREVGILNTFWALVLPNLVSPFFLIIVVSYFRGYPEEIIESAVVDGASQLRIFWQIIWPTSLPMIATIAMLYGTFHWNEYFWSRILVQDNLHPATVVLYSIQENRQLLRGLGLGVQTVPQSFVSAVSATLIIPVLIVYPFLQRFVVKGLLIGSVKG